MCDTHTCGAVDVVRLLSVVCGGILVGWVL